MWAKLLFVLVGIAAVSISFFGYEINEFFEEAYLKAPRDASFSGPLKKLNSISLSEFYTDRQILVVGGTRGIGYLTAMTIAKHGGNITIIGSNATAGDLALSSFAARAQSPLQNFSFLKGNFSTADTTLETIKRIIAEGKVYDAMIVTINVRHDWEDPLNQDSLVKSIAVGNLARFILFQECHQFLKPKARILNIMNSGYHPRLDSLDKAYIKGEKSFASFPYVHRTVSLVNEIILQKLKEVWNSNGFKVIGTTPGWSTTEPFRREGLSWISQLLYSLKDLLFALPGEELGCRQASILASPLLDKKLQFVDSEMYVRRTSPKLSRLSELNKEWLWEHFSDLYNKAKSKQ